MASADWGIPTSGFIGLLICLWIILKGEFLGGLWIKIHLKPCDLSCLIHQDFVCSDGIQHHLQTFFHSFSLKSMIIFVHFSFKSDAITYISLHSFPLLLHLSLYHKENELFFHWPLSIAVILKEESGRAKYRRADSSVPFIGLPPSQGWAHFSADCISFRRSAPFL